MNNKWQFNFGLTRLLVGKTNCGVLSHQWDDLHIYALISIINYFLSPTFTFINLANEISNFTPNAGGFRP
jgi:ABC-type enterochelin transport system permease subunit